MGKSDILRAVAISTIRPIKSITTLPRMRHFSYLAALLAISTSAPAVMKCSGGDGKTWYQDQPCLPGASAVQLQGSGFYPPVYPQDSVQPIVVQPEPARPLPPPPAHIPMAVYEQEAAMCLAWYKKEIQLPTNTQYVDLTKDQRVLTITLPVPVISIDSLGIQRQSTTTKQASCEIHNGRLDDGWTRIHAKRGGWIQ